MKIKKYDFERENEFSILMEDKNICFWVDCCFIDGYGKRANYCDNDIFIDWEFNKYIFCVEDENDIKIMNYQENQNNRDKIQELFDEYNYELIELYRKAKNGGNYEK